MTLTFEEAQEVDLMMRRSEYPEPPAKAGRIQSVSNLAWQPGGRPPKYGAIYERLTVPGRWFVVEFATVAEADRARGALYRHARGMGWAVSVSIDRQAPAGRVRLGIRRVA